MVEVRVEFEYPAAADDELTLKVGDVIKEVQKHDGGWWEGVLHGKRGVFPDNFVREIEEEKTKEAPAPTVRKGSGGHVSELATKLNQGGGIKMGPPSRHPPRREAPKKNPMAKVTFPYKANNEDELSLQEGGVVEVLKQEEEGWWQGSLDGQIGMFPSNFVELMDDADQAQNGDEERQIKGPKPKGFGFGNIFSDGSIKLRSTTDTRAEQPKKITPKQAPKSRSVPPPPDSPSSPRIQKDGKPCERARAIFTYEATATDELSLHEGDVITILDKNLNDPGWWRGEINGKHGVFPDNFVELLPPESIHKHDKPKKPPPPPMSPLAKDAVDNPLSPTSPSGPRTHETDDSHGAPGDQAKPTRPPSVAAPPAPRKKHAKPEDHHHQSEEHQAQNGDAPTPSSPAPQIPSRKAAHPSVKQSRSKDHVEPPPSRKNKDNKEPEKTVPTHAVRPQSTRREEVHSPRRAAPARPPSAHSQDHSADDTPSNDVEELQKELASLRANTVSREQYEELHKDMTGLKESLEQVKNTINKRVYDLMAEVDEEKKTRLNMEVEIERLKKLVMS